MAIRPRISCCVWDTRYVQLSAQPLKGIIGGGFGVAGPGRSAQVLLPSTRLAGKGPLLISSEQRRHRNVAEEGPAQTTTPRLWRFRKRSDNHSGDGGNSRQT